jgi:hypothetical protein
MDLLGRQTEVELTTGAVIKEGDGRAVFLQKPGSAGPAK